MTTLEEWKNHPAAERIGGTVVDTDNGYFNILNGRLYDFDNREVIQVDYTITPQIGDWIEVIAYRAGTSDEVFYDENPTTIAELFHSLEFVAPAA